MLLDQIIEQKHIEVAQLPETALDQLPINQRDFAKAIRSNPHAVIAELKSRSPSEGIICPDYHPIDIAHQYINGGAAAISVLTDEHFFGGCFADMYHLAHYFDIPLLCKDFIIDAKQVQQARAHGASACLLIVRILSDEQLKQLNQVIESLGMVALVEIFDETDLERALAIQPKIIGINNRCLDTLKMDTNNAVRLKPLIPDTIQIVALSGAQTPQQCRKITDQFDAVLVGTALMKSHNRVGFLKAVKNE